MALKPVGEKRFQGGPVALDQGLPTGFKQVGDGGDAIFGAQPFGRSADDAFNVQAAHGGGGDLETELTPRV